MSLALCGLALIPLAEAAQAQVWQSDQGNGSYRNPVLFADYPDPDIIRVGQDFYFITTTFANAPGMTILHSRDLVNWTIAGHVLDRLDGDKRFDLEDGGSYRQGFFAASMRYRDGIFYVAVTPVGHKTRIYRASDVAGPWTRNDLEVEAFDPALFFDKDCASYLATAIGSDGTITLLTLDDDLRRVQASKIIHYNEGAEGTKIIRRGDWYYLFNAIPRRLGLTVSRARELSGPWETRNQIDDSSGGHQGALVDLPDGSWFGFVMRDAGAIGRVTNISPVFWRDDWPVWGTPEAPDRVPGMAPKPIAGEPPAQPRTSDDFSAPELGAQWQWNHNPLDGKWSLIERPGFLRLHATHADGLWSARNTLLQKAQGPRAQGEVKIDVTGIRDGDVCGFGTFGKISAGLYVHGVDGRKVIGMQIVDATDVGPRLMDRTGPVTLNANVLWLRADLDFDSETGSAAYSEDGRSWHPIGGAFPLAFDWRTGTFQGEQFALSCYNPGSGGGHIDFDSFTLRALP